MTIPPPPSPCSEDAIRGLIELCEVARLDHEDDVAAAWEAGERPDLWDAPEVTVPLHALTALLLRAETAEREVANIDAIATETYARLRSERDEAEREREALRGAIPRPVICGAAANGSYARGHDNGWNAAIRAFHEALAVSTALLGEGDQS